MRWILLPLCFALLLMSFIVQAQTETVFPIQPGSIEGNINDSFDKVRYSFEAEAGQTITLTMERTSGNLDSFLLLFDLNNSLLDDNDDFEEGNQDAQIIFTPDVSGTYIVETTRFGEGSGTFRLILNVGGTDGEAESIDPLSLAPQFGVDFNFIEYEAFGTGSLNPTERGTYFALGGQQGEFLRMIVTPTQPELTLTVRLLDSDLNEISRLVSREETGEQIINALLPQTGWYLAEVEQQSGTGDFTLYTTRISDTVLSPVEAITSSVNAATPVVSYVFNATIGERIFINMTVLDGDGTIPEVAIFDLDQNELVSAESQGTQTGVSLTVPRSAPYIVQARNNGTTSEMTFRVALSTIVTDTSKLRIRDAQYNEQFKGTISDTNPINYYRLNGKVGELITVQMRPVDTDSELDPYLILMDSDLNELAFSDNVSGTRNARIAQVELPADGNYFILATRPRLSLGNSAGNYEMDLTVGAISLREGALTATLTWEGAADLNLFVLPPVGAPISWSNAAGLNDGLLQIDSNTNCQTPTDQPVEHIFWPTLPADVGDYTVWVWYQNVCGARVESPFTLEITFNGQVVASLTSTEQNPLVLQPDERFEVRFRTGADGGFQVLNPGSRKIPTPQERASEGGDIQMTYGQNLIGTISDEVYALFYQFQGNAGDVVTITAERITGDLDPIVVLRDAQEQTIVVSDDDTVDLNEQFTVTLEADGRYVIAVTRFGLRDGTTGGDFRLSLVREEE